MGIYEETVHKYNFGVIFVRTVPDLSVPISEPNTHAITRNFDSF